MLPVSYDPLFVTASVLVAIMASFTGLRLASGLGQLEPARRKPEIAKAAIALGGGTRSMHFAGMLAVKDADADRVWRARHPRLRSGRHTQSPASA